MPKESGGRKTAKRVTEGFERYLDAIYEIHCSGKEVRVGELADQLGISMPSVSEMVERLVQGSFVKHDKYSKIELTEKGQTIAEKLRRRHQVLRTFFISILGVDEEVADQDACEIEHVISDETMDRLIAYLESTAPDR